MRQYLRHLANFAYVSQYGSLTGAARKLDTSPSVLSQSIKILENHYREPLLIRHKQGVRLTARGESIYKDCQQILESASLALEQTSHDPIGLVRLTCVTEIADFWLAGAHSTLLKKYPGVDLSIHSEDSRLEPQKEGRDLFVRVDQNPRTDGLHVFHRYRVNVVLAGSTRHRPTRSKSDSKLHVDLLAADHRHALNKYPLSTYGVSADRLVQCDTASTRVQLAAAGTCVAYCLEPTIKAIGSKKFVDLSPGTVLTKVDLIIAGTESGQTAAVELVAKVLAEHVESLGCYS